MFTKFTMFTFWSSVTGSAGRRWHEHNSLRLGHGGHNALTLACNPLSALTIAAHNAVIMRLLLPLQAPPSLGRAFAFAFAASR
ncbi:hypothetical protein A4U49_01660 [Acidithiobacillus ferrivorans]|nr:hypothetical protein [Acidithiobacillus ferrivorans]OFA17524.1 hypothetical protein A4U49_01660 [Acidithiobacillus ferrivorans]